MRSRTIAAAVSVVAAVLVSAGLREASAAQLEGAASQLSDAQRLFYNGRYEEAAALTHPLCPDASPAPDLNACEVRSSALLFQIKRRLPKGMKKDEAYKACPTCPALMTAFRAVTQTAQLAARTTLKSTPTDLATRYLLGKIDLNHVWLNLGLIGRRTGWSEYWEARHAMDDVLKVDPANVRARVSRAWIDYIVDTQAPRGTRWILGGGNKTRGLRVVEEAAIVQDAPFVRAEAGFALWDMRVREGNVAGAVVIARELARDFPENEELTKFLTEQSAIALQ